MGRSSRTDGLLGGSSQVDVLSYFNRGYIAMCDISPVDIYGRDTVPAINRQV